MRGAIHTSLVTLIVTATISTVSASGPSGASQDADSAKPAPALTSATPASAPEPFAALRGVNAAPMSRAELAVVKGQDAHFATPSQNELLGITGLHVIVRNNRDHWLDLGNGILVAPGYRGLCGAALNSPKMFIPGQNPATGIGGGC